MRLIRQDQIKGYNAEQIAGITLKILQEINSGERQVSYYGGSLESILAFELAPIWLGKDVRNGCLIHPGGGVSSYGGDTAPTKLKELYEEAIELLRKENLIKQDPAQRSAVFVKLNNKGKTMKINHRFELNIDRKPEAIIDKFRKSVFLMETYKDEEVSCGTCFLVEDGFLVTCKHNIDGRNFSIHFDEETKLDDSQFNISFHKERDLAIISFKSDRLATIVNDFEPFEIEDEDDLTLGEFLVTMGYPLVSLRHVQLLPDVGTFQNYTTGYLDGLKYLTFTNRVDGGCSGGPVISLRGKVVGVITESTEQALESNGGRSQGTNIYRHGTPSIHVYDESFEDVKQ